MWSVLRLRPSIACQYMSAEVSGECRAPLSTPTNTQIYSKPRILPVNLLEGHPHWLLGRLADTEGSRVGFGDKPRAGSQVNFQVWSQYLR